jgi:hypothetical protein
MDICLEEAPVACQPAAQRFALRFQSLFNQGRAMVFPCNAQGQVDIDSLSERARDNYLYARAVVGFEYAAPAVTRDYSAV